MPGFDALGVPAPILAALETMGYREPTAVQAQAIPPLLAGKDALVEAQTGSGKTTAFGIPAVRVGAKSPGLRVLVLVPTRELARQVADELRELGAGSPFRAVAVTGGVQAEKEDRAIAGDVRCIVATPGRLLALLDERRIRPEGVELVVLDEADRMLDMGFLSDVEKVLEAASKRKQTALFSATLPREVTQLAARHLREPIEVRVHREALPPTLEHFRVNVFPEQKEAALVALLKKESPERCIVFVRTRDRAAAFAKLLKKEGIAADPLQGDMSHDQRRHVFDLFARGTTKVLVATDIASRGLDVPEMQLVVNADLPDEDDAYTHRAGRAARLGREGKVVSFVLPDEKPQRERLERETGKPWTPYRLDFEAPPKAPPPPPRQWRPRAAPAKKPAPKGKPAPPDVPPSRRGREKREG